MDDEPDKPTKKELKNNVNRECKAALEESKLLSLHWRNLQEN